MSMGDYSNNLDRNDYDIGASQTVQSDVLNVANKLEAALDLQESQINALLANYQADGVSEEYQKLHANWNSAGTQVREIIKQIRHTLEQNDGIASGALSKARAAVHF